MDRGFVGLNLVYLAFVAFLPFPTDLLGNYFENPISIVTYAINVALVSGMEVVLFRKAYRDRLLTERLPGDVYRWGVMASLSPVLFFVLSIPVAFLNTTAAVLVWLLGIPFQLLVLQRRKPPAADDYLG
jgi:uncharacterized membrane protein